MKTKIFLVTLFALGLFYNCKNESKQANEDTEMEATTDVQDLK